MAYRGELGYANKKYDILLNGEYRDFGDYTDGNGVVVPSSFKTLSYSLKSELIFRIIKDCNLIGVKNLEVISSMQVCLWILQRTIVI
ncbi:MAG: hypothetical protein R2771_13135 [Saprospiraceae bacterium]